MPKKAPHNFIPAPGVPVNLQDFNPDDDGGLTKKDAQKEMDTLREQLAGLQEKLYAERRQSLLIILQAMDTGGKDGTIKHVFEGVNPQGVNVASFKAPTLDELAHDFLWRIHAHAPAKGQITIFNRSHYEDVLVVRVEKLVSEEIWQQRYEQINNFEKLLADNGTRILKFYLHISKDEQRERLQARLDDPEKHWKFSLGDLPVRRKWDEYMSAYQDAITHCNTDDAPWFIVPANRKWYRNLVVTRAIVQTLEAMNPAFPPAEDGLDKVVIPD